MSGEAQEPRQLPAKLTAEVEIGGRALPGAFVAVDLPMYEKNTYKLFFGPADSSGRIEIDRAAFERQIAATLETGLMDYASLNAWTGDLLVAAWNVDDIDRALSGYATWGSVIDSYPSEFTALMKGLRERLVANANARLSVRVQTVPAQRVAVITHDKLAGSAPDIADPS
jgi:hypothetical protein